MLQLLADGVFRIDTSVQWGSKSDKTPEEMPANNLGEKQSVSENPARLGGVLYFVAPRASNGPFRGVALLIRLEESAPISWMGEPG